MLTLAVRVPDALGVNVAEIVQEAPAASVLGLSGQVVVRAKSVGLEPVIDMLVMVSGPLPVFLRVDDCAALVVAIACVPKVRLPGVSETAGPGGGDVELPVPLSAAVCGLPDASSVILRLALRLPVADGENVTDTEQEAPAGTVLGLVGHVVVQPKSPGFVPDTAMPEIVSAAVPEFVSVTGAGTLDVPICCEPKLRLVGDRVTPGAGGGGAEVPVPLSVAVCGLPDALSVTVRPALRLPVADGENVTEAEHDAPAASVLPHVFVCAKSAAFEPETAMLEIVNAALPEFVSVRDFEELDVPTCCDPKLRLVGDRVTAGAGGGALAPVPDSARVCGLPEALSAMLTLAERDPDAPGVNVTEMEQEAPAASEPGQFELWAKSPAFVPVTDMPEIVRAALPVLVSVDDFAALVVPTVCDPNERLDGLSEAAGAGGGAAPVVTVKTASP
jgi:hypothetical protein